VLKLGDFGVARVLESTQELALTKVGTPCYIAPERCEGKPYSYEADVWSLGCLLYELLTMHPAFSAETIPAVSEMILSGSFRAFTPSDGVDSELQALVARILTVDTAIRPRIDDLLEEPLLATYVARHDDVRTEFANEGMSHGIVSVDIPLIGYEDSNSTKTKFSERPVFVDGGGRIVDEKALSAHDEKLLGARQRRQRMAASKGRCGAGSSAPAKGGNFDQVQNFGAGGVVGFLVQSGATSSAGAAADISDGAGAGGGEGAR